MKRILLLPILVFCALFYLRGQVSGYTFSQSSGSYSAITGGTLFKNTGTTSIDDDNYNSLNIGFTFTYDGTPYTNFSINANGFLVLAATASSSYDPLTFANNAISALGDDLLGRQFVTGSTTSGNNVVSVTSGSTSGMAVGNLLTGTGIATGATITALTATTITMSANASTTGTGRNIRAINCGEIRYETIGSAPNRTLVVQWSKFSRYATTSPSDYLDFQIRLNETSNTIDIVYDFPYVHSTTSITTQVGLRGASGTDFNTRTSTTSWSATTAGGANSSTVTLTGSIVPSSGLTFTWTPPVPPSCLAPTAPTVSTITATGANLSWTAPASAPSNGYQWAVTTSATPPGSGTAEAGTSAAATGLSSNTTYYLHVRSDCDGDGFSDWATSASFKTPLSCGDTFYDSGGSGGSYASNENIVTTICPSVSGELVVATFTSFSTESGYDGLVIYDGNSTAAAIISSGLPAGSNATTAPAGSYYGATSPGTKTSSAANGCLTFQFRSDGSGVSSGWVAGITCIPPPTCAPPSALTTTNITATTADLGWTAPASAPSDGYEWEVRTSATPGGGTLAASGSTAAGMTMATATGLMGITTYYLHVRSNCGGGDYSSWAVSGAFTTLPVNDNPAGAIALTVGVAQSISTVGATQTLVACTGTADDDVWFAFTPPSDGAYTMAFVGLTGTTNIGYEIFSSDPGSGGVSLACHDGPDGGASHDGYLSSSTYYIRVYSWTSAGATRITGGTITMSAYAGTPPANNDCTGATVVSVSTNGSCSYTSFNSTGATYSLVRPSCVTALSPPAYNDDLWVEFTSTGAGSYNFKMTASGTYGMEIYTGSCGSLSPLAGSCSTSFTGTTGVSRTLAASTVYYLRLWRTQTTGGGAYDVCIEAPPTCFAPTAPAVTNITATDANLSWTAPASAPSDGYEWEVRTSTTPGGGTLAANGNTAAGVTMASATGLTANTTYYLHVRSNCSVVDGFSTWATSASFKTPCDAFVVPFQEGFNSASTTESCWTVLNVNADADTWEMNYTSNPYEGNQAAVIYTDINAGNNNDYLISPGIILTGGERLKYHYRVQSGGEPNDFEVLLSTTGVASGDFSTTLLANTSYSNTTYIEQIIDLSAYSGTVYIAWHVPNGGLDGWRLYIDNVIIEEIPSSPPACVANETAILDGSCGNYNVPMSWDASALADGYKLTIGTTTGGTDVLNTSNLGSATSYTLVAPTPGTTYYWTVVPYNANGDAIGCTENLFATVAVGCYCASSPSSNDASGITNVLLGSTNFPNGDVTYFDHTATIVDLAQSASATVMITFATGYTYDTNIWIDFNDDYDFTDAGELVYTGESLSANPTSLNASFVMPAAPLGNHRMRIGTADSGQATPNPCYSDTYGVTLDFTVNVIAPPSCLVPSALSATNITTTSADVSWTAPAAAPSGGYEWAVTTSATPPASGASTGSTSAMAMGLSSSTTYYLHVRSDCDVDGFSDWATSVPFATLTPPPANNEKAGAITLVQYFSNTCVSPTNGTVAGATQSESPCTGTANDDVWYRFQAVTTNPRIFTSGFDGVIQLQTAAGTEVACQDNFGTTDQLNATNLTVGDIYFIRFYSYLSTNLSGTAAQFTICVYGEPAAPPTVAACTPISDIQINSAMGNTNVWVPLVSSNGVVAAINANGNELGSVTGEFYKHSGTIREAGDIQYLDRNFAINVGTQPVTPVSVRLYFLNSELTNLGQPLASVNLTRVSGGSCENMFTGTGSFVSQSGNGTLGATASFAEYSIPAFSSFYVHAGSNALPVDLMYFNGQATEAGNKLNWATASEENTRHFAIERSTDGRSAWQTVGTVAAKGFSQSVQEYAFMDDKPTATAYYRLRMEDFDGSFEYSNIVYLQRSYKGGDMTVYPVPTNTEVQLGFVVDAASTATFTVTDMAGRTVMQLQRQLQSGLQNESLDVSQLPNGVYLVAVEVNGERFIQRMVKQ